MPQDHLPADHIRRATRTRAPSADARRGDERWDDEPRDEGEAKKPSDDKSKKKDNPRRRLIIRIVIGIVVLIALVAAIRYAFYYFNTGRYLETTDDAYTQADNTTISPQVSGYIAELLVTDNQAVQAGDLLARIDDRDYRATVDQATADIQGATADIANLDAQIVQQQAVIEQNQADIKSAQSQAVFAQQNFERYQTLAKTGYGTVQTYQQSKATLDGAQATVAHDQATLEQTRKQIDVLHTQRDKAVATLAHDQASLEQAKLNLGYTQLRTPIDGAVGDRTVRVGQYVQPGSQLMTVVPMRAGIYVVANFKETQLVSMFRGEHVTLTFDTFPGVTVDGRVDSLSPGSGSQFSLLPPENATGNFTKIVQRVPVKITIDPAHDPIIDQLRPGLSTNASVDTRTKPPQGAATLVSEERLKPNGRPVQ